MTLSLPQLRRLERDAVEEKIREIRDNSADINRPTIGYQPIEKFNTELLAGMLFPYFFYYGVGDPTVTV